MELRRSASLRLTILVLSLAAEAWTHSRDELICSIPVSKLYDRSASEPDGLCGECLGAGSQCGWCLNHENLQITLLNRCDLVSTLISAGCNQSYIANTQLSKNKNSVVCSGRGTYECDQCTCNDGFYGPNCECDVAIEGSKVESDKACLKRIGSMPCEGRGQCICGGCTCNSILSSELTKTYSGKYCECNDYSCEFYEKKLCGGPERGRCVCGECLCNEGYGGKGCSCKLGTGNETCMASTGLICNNRGSCDCGYCKCEAGFMGPTCEVCPTCEKCDQKKDCALCVGFGTGPMKDDMETCIATCGDTVVVDQLHAQWTQCSPLLDETDNCDVLYSYDQYAEMFHVQQTKRCRSKQSEEIRLTSGESAKIGNCVHLLTMSLATIITVMCSIINPLIQI